MSPLFGAGACLHGSVHRNFALCAIPIDCSLLLHQKGTFQTPLPHINLSICITKFHSSQKKSAVLLRNCPPMRPDACALPVPPPARSAPMRPHRTGARGPVPPWMRSVPDVRFGVVGSSSRREFTYTHLARLAIATTCNTCPKRSHFY